MEAFLSLLADRARFHAYVFAGVGLPLTLATLAGLVPATALAAALTSMTAGMLVGEVVVMVLAGLMYAVLRTVNYLADRYDSPTR